MNFFSLSKHYKQFPITQSSKWSTWELHQASNLANKYLLRPYYVVVHEAPRAHVQKSNSN